MLTRLALHLLSRVAAACGLDALERAAAAGGQLAYGLGIRRSVVRHNLHQVYGRRLSDRQRRRVMRQSYATVAANFIALFHVGRRGGAQHGEITVVAPTHLASLLGQGGGSGIIWQTGHLGNWDLGAALIGYYDGPFQVYAKPQANAEADAVINGLREALGFQVLLAAHGDRRGAVRAARGLRDGVSLGLIADQGPPPARGVGAWFLGQAVSCHAGSAFFARQCQVPVVTGFLARSGAGRYRFYHFAPVAPQGWSESALLQHLLDQLSACIVALPGQYFWQHRRFKYAMSAPPREDGERWRRLDVLRPDAQ